MEKRLQELSKRCADTHTTEDIWEHLEEELIELLLAIKRAKRQREPFDNVLEELVDVKIEINTVLTQLNRPKEVNEMVAKKLDKFEAMLEKEKSMYFYGNICLQIVDRYKTIKLAISKFIIGV